MIRCRASDGSLGGGLLFGERPLLLEESLFHFFFDEGRFLFHLCSCLLRHSDQFLSAPAVGFCHQPKSFFSFLFSLFSFAFALFSFLSSSFPIMLFIVSLSLPSTSMASFNFLLALCLVGEIFLHVYSCILVPK